MYLSWFTGWRISTRTLELNSTLLDCEDVVTATSIAGRIVNIELEYNVTIACVTLILHDFFQIQDFSMKMKLRRTIPLHQLQKRLSKSNCLQKLSLNSVIRTWYAVMCLTNV